MLVVAGVALAFAMTVAIVGGSLVARQQALGRALGALPESAQGFRVDRFGTPLSRQTYAREDRAVRRVLGTLVAGRGAPRRLLPAAAGRAGNWSRSPASTGSRRSSACGRAGCRAPARLRRARCSRSAAAETPACTEGDVRLGRVGIAELRDPGLFGYISAAAAGPGRAADPSCSRRASSRSSGCRRSSPSTASTPGSRRCAPTGLHTWDVARTLAAESRGQTALYATDSAFRLSSPDDELLTATGAARIAARRLILVGGETSALLLGFAIIAAIGLRRGLGAERRRLLARGARRWQAWLALAAEVGAMTLAGALLGIAVGSADRGRDRGRRRTAGRSDPRPTRCSPAGRSAALVGRRSPR